MRLLGLGLLLMSVSHLFACEGGTSIEVNVGNVDYYDANSVFTTCSLLFGEKQVGVQVNHYLKDMHLANYHSVPTTNLERLEDAVIKRIGNSQIESTPREGFQLPLPLLSSEIDESNKAIYLPNIRSSKGTQLRKLRVSFRNGSGDPAKRFSILLLEFDGDKATVRKDLAAQRAIVWAMKRCGNFSLEPR
jgi:hypothetical protein